MLDITIPDIRDSKENIDKLDIESLLKARKQIKEVKNHYDTVLEYMELRIKDNCESTCHVCEKNGNGFMDIPDGWGYLSASNNELLCQDCLYKWLEKFGELPKITKELVI